MPHIGSNRETVYRVYIVRWHPFRTVYDCMYSSVAVSAICLDSSVFFMESLINLVAVISSHAERVSLDIARSSSSELEHYVFAFVGLVCLALTAGILTGIGAVRAITAFFFASAVYFYMGGILLKIAGLLSIVAAFSALLSLAFRSSTPLPKSAAPSDLPSSSTSTSPPSSSKPKRSACMPSQISVL